MTAISAPEVKRDAFRPTVIEHREVWEFVYPAPFQVFTLTMVKPIAPITDDEFNQIGWNRFEKDFARQGFIFCDVPLRGTTEDRYDTSVGIVRLFQKVGYAYRSRVPSHVEKLYRVRHRFSYGPARIFHDIRDLGIGARYRAWTWDDRLDYQAWTNPSDLLDQHDHDPYVARHPDDPGVEVPDWHADMLAESLRRDELDPERRFRQAPRHQEDE